MIFVAGGYTAAGQDQVTLLSAPLQGRLHLFGPVQHMAKIHELVAEL